MKFKVFIHIRRILLGRIKLQVSVLLVEANTRKIISLIEDLSDLDLMPDILGKNWPNNGYGRIYPAHNTSHAYNFHDVGRPIDVEFLLIEGDLKKGAVVRSIVSEEEEALRLSLVSYSKPIMGLIGVHQVGDVITL